MTIPTRSASNEFVQSVDRAFAVILAFGRERPRLKLSEVAEHAKLSRATARRFLLTLEALGYVGFNGTEFYLRPRMLDLGFAYLSSIPVWEVVESHMEGLVQEVQESSLCSVLDDTEIVITVRVRTKRIMNIQMDVGTRLSAYSTSMGRVLLAALGSDQLDEYFARAELKPLTPRTITDERRLRDILDEVREQGWCIMDQELEVGVRSAAAPLHDSSGRVFAAMNLATHVTRVPADRLVDHYLPLLRTTATSIEDDLRSRRLLV